MATLSVTSEKLRLRKGQLPRHLELPNLLCLLTIRRRKASRSSASIDCPKTFFRRVFLSYLTPPHPYASRQSALAFFCLFVFVFVFVFVFLFQREWRKYTVCKQARIGQMKKYLLPRWE